MTQPEQRPSLEDMQKVFRGMQVRMRNYALHHHGHIGARTLVALQDLDLFEDPVEDRLGASIDLEVLCNPEHPRRMRLPPGPLLLYLTQGEKPKRMVVEVPVLLFSELPDVRKAAFAYLERMVADGSLPVTPKTRDVLEKSRAGVLSETSHDWRPAAIALSDAFCDDVQVALEGARQSLHCEPIIQDSLNTYVPRVIQPAVSSLDSLAPEVRNPEAEHPRLLEIIAAIVREAGSLGDACARYHARLGHLPLAPPYAMSEVVARWTAEHPAAEAWTEVWGWARGAAGPIPRYHACTVFVLRPELIPDGKLPDLWQELVGVVHESGKKGADSVEHEPWALRRDLARHFAYHLEAHLPDNDGANIASFAWWFAERVASLFPDEPASAQFYRKNWVEPAADKSVHMWLAASPHIGRSFLRYVTATVSSPWATALLTLMGSTMERLVPQDQSAETQARFHEALVSCLIGALPVTVESPPDPTYAQECALGETALKWAAHQPEDQRKALEQLVATSRTLGSAAGLCKALREMAGKSLADQVAVALALKARAYTEPTLAPAVWEVVSDAEWRQSVLGTVEDRVLGLVIEALALIQADAREKWFSLFPHYIAELCEKTDNDERRRQLFLYVLHTSLASDTVSAVRRLLRGTQKGKFLELVKEYRERAESMWALYPPWVAGKVRALLASLRVL